MFKITAKGKKHGLLWDSKENKPLIKFVNGAATTENEEVAEKLKTMGFSVTKVKTKGKSEDTSQTADTSNDDTSNTENEGKSE